jgi:hypothetical protein
MQQGDDPDVWAIDAVLAAGPLELAERLVHCPIFANDNARFESLVQVWRRALRGVLRPVVLEKVRAAIVEPESVPRLAMYAIAQGATTIADHELLLSVLRWTGVNASDAQVEELPVGDWLAQPLPVIVESITHLCANRRLMRYPSLRATVCALVLLGRVPCDAHALAQIAEGLAQAADVRIEAIRCAVAEYSLAALLTWGMAPAKFRQWLFARLPLITDWSEWHGEPAPHDPESTAALRKLVTHLCSVLRWVAAQSEGSSDDRADIQACLSAISGLAWRNPSRWTLPFLEGDGQGTPVALDELDPLRASPCWRAGQWLAAEGWLPSTELPPHADLQQAATRAIVDLVFNEVPPADLDRIATALGQALGTPAPREEGKLAESPWLQVFEAIARTVDAPWIPVWSTSITYDHKLFPDRLDTYLKRLRKRLVQVADEIGWHPELLDISVNLAAVLGDDELSEEGQEYLLIPALATMDPAIVTNVPNHQTWPPMLQPISIARTVPRALASAVGSWEICERGMLWQICRDMCRPSQDPRWWESVRVFREVVRATALYNTKPRVIWYKRESAETLVEAALAPINLLLDDSPRKQDFDQVADETNVNPDSSYVRLKACLNANPRPELLQWAVEEVAGRNPKYALWLLKPLIANRRWDLLHYLLNGLYGEETDAEQNWLSGFRLPEAAGPASAEPALRWPARVEAALGLGPEEELIYGVGELAQHSISGTLFQEGRILSYREQIHLAENWEDQLRKLFHQEGTDQKELARTLLTIALLSGSQEPARLAEQLVSESGEALEAELGPELLWVGRAVAPGLVRDERIFRFARSGRGLNVLTTLGAWDAVRLHLQSCAGKEPAGTHSTDPLLQWYHACGSLGLDEQLTCLQIYNEMAPRLLAARAVNAGLAPEVGAAALMPVHNVSSSLKFSESSLAEHLVRAAQSTRPDLVRAWFQALLIEAAYGPDRKQDLDCIRTVCRCAGAWLTVEPDALFRDPWLSFLKALSKQLGTRSVWNAFFGGVGMCLGREFGADRGRWIVRDDSGALLALAESLAEYGTSSDAEFFWNRLLEGSASPWLAIRACASFLGGETSADARRLAQKFAALAWLQAQGRDENREPRFLANLVAYAIQAQSETVLTDIAKAVAQDIPRAAALGRVALDTFLQHVRNVEPDQQASADGDLQAWTLSDIMYIEGLGTLFAALVQESAYPPGDAEDMGRYDHGWHDTGIRDDLGWLTSLLKEIFNPDQPQPLLTWVADWLTRIPPDRDADGRVCEGIVSAMEQHPGELPDVYQPLRDFAIAVLQVFQGDPRQRFDLALKLIKAQYRIADCLRIVDSSLDTLVQWGYVDGFLAQVAVVCARELPGSDLAQRYLSQVTAADKRFLAEDEVAELQGMPLHKRLAQLNRAPQASEVVQRMVEICGKMLDQLGDLNQDALGTLAPILTRLSPDHRRLHEQIAGAVSDLLQPQELITLHDAAERVRRLAQLLAVQP